MSVAEIPAAESPYEADTVSVNDKTRRKQRLLWGVAMTVMIGAAGWFLWDYVADDGGTKSVKDPETEARLTATAGVAKGTDDSSRELAVRASSLEGDNRQLEADKAQLEQEVERLKSEAATNHDNATKTIGALSKELEMRSAAGSPAGSPAPGGATLQNVAPPPYSSAGDPFAPVGAGGGQAAINNMAGAIGNKTMGDGTQVPPTRRSVSVIRAGGKPAEAAKTEAAPASTPAAGSEFVRSGLAKYDSKRFVPPNAYVKAKVLVGVDAATGVTQQADPKPVMFRLTGPATHVGTNGKFQTTDLTGCMVNGAAYAELPSEKVYIKLQRITCPAGPTEFSVAAVEGYVSHRGKAGVRGQVISRDSGLMGRALVAGTLQGLGQAMENYTNRSLNGLSVGAGGQLEGAPPLKGGQVAAGAIGGGVGNAASTLADYWVKRAEQYQPVVEMPTGIEVELVFLTGFEVGPKR